MAPTPSASALSAVLRCQGNIWTRNTPTKKPATSAYNLGLAGGALRDSPAERKRSKQASAWAAFLYGRGVIAGGRLTVAYESTQVNDKMKRRKDCAKTNKSHYPKHSHSPGVTRSAVSCVQNAVVRHLAHTLTPVLDRIDKCFQIIHMIKQGACVARVCKIVFLGEMGEFPSGDLKLYITSPPRLMEKTGHLPPFVLMGWSRVRSTSLTALVSEFVFLRMVMLWIGDSSSADAPHHLQCPQKERAAENYVQQANGQIHSPASMDTSSRGQKITEDRPD